MSCEEFDTLERALERSNNAWLRVDALKGVDIGQIVRILPQAFELAPGGGAPEADRVRMTFADGLTSREERRLAFIRKRNSTNSRKRKLPSDLQRAVAKRDPNFVPLPPSLRGLNSEVHERLMSLSAQTPEEKKLRDEEIETAKAHRSLVFVFEAVVARFLSARRTTENLKDLSKWLSKSLPKIKVGDLTSKQARRRLELLADLVPFWCEIWTRSNDRTKMFKINNVRADLETVRAKLQRISDAGCVVAASGEDGGGGSPSAKLASRVAPVTESKSPGETPIAARETPITRSALKPPAKPPSLRPARRDR